MKKTLNIKKMIKNMDIRDRTGLLISHFNSAASDKLLTGEERQFLYESCVKEKKMEKLISNVRSYHLVKGAVFDLKAHKLMLELGISKLETILLVMFGITSKTDDFLAISAQLHDINTPEAIRLAEWIEKNHGNVPPEWDLYVEDKAITEPNRALQFHAVNALKANHFLRSSLYVIECLEQAIGINCLSDSDQKLCRSARDQLLIFSQLEPLKLALQYCVKAYELGFIDPKKFSEPQFFQLMTDFTKSIELPSEEKIRIQKETKKMLSNYHPAP